VFKLLELNSKLCDPVLDRKKFKLQYVAKCEDDLRLGVKGQSNSDIAGFLRKSCKRNVNYLKIEVKYVKISK